MAQEGVVIPVGELIAVMTGPDEPLPDDLIDQSTPAAEPTQPATDKVGQDAVSSSPEAAPATSAASGSEVRASPIARRLAKERGVDLALIAGTGPGGRIVEQDVLTYHGDARCGGDARWHGASFSHCAALSPGAGHRVDQYHRHGPRRTGRRKGRSKHTRKHPLPKSRSQRLPTSEWNFPGCVRPSLG